MSLIKVTASPPTPGGVNQFPETRSHANKSWDALVTSVAILPAALVTSAKILVPSLTVCNRGGSVSNIPDTWAASLTEGFYGIKNVPLSEVRCKGGDGDGDGDRLGDCTRQEGRGHEDDCSNAKEHVYLSKGL